MARYPLGALVAVALTVGTLACGDGAGVDDVDVDLPSEDAITIGRACPIATGRTCRAAEPRDVVTLASGGFHMPAGGFALRDKSFVAIGSRLDAAKLVASRLLPGGRPPTTELLAWNDVFEGSSVADPAGGGALYFTGVDGQGASLFRARIDPAGVMAAPERVTLAGAETFPEWPQTVALPDGRVVLSFRKLNERGFLAVSDASGLRFDVRPAPITPGVLPGVLVHPGVTKRGAWVLTHQLHDGQFAFTSFVQISRDGGRTFGARVNVQPADPNVHDASVVARLDEGADVYYVRAGSAPSFSVYRRMLREDGTLGPEQIVTSTAVGHVEKPQARRMTDGRLALTFARRMTEALYDHALVVLAGDAPR